MIDEPVDLNTQPANQTFDEILEAQLKTAHFKNDTRSIRQLETLREAMSRFKTEMMNRDALESYYENEEPVRKMLMRGGE